MSDEAFADLKEALEDAFSFERGERRELMITRIKGSRPPVRIPAGAPIITESSTRGAKMERSSHYGRSELIEDWKSFLT